MARAYADAVAPDRGRPAATDAAPAPGAAPVVHARFFALDAWRGWQREARALLDPAELARVQRKHRPGDGDDLALAYALHRLVLAEALGCPPQAVALARDAAGRPLVAGEPLQASLSHAEGCVAIAVGGPGALGIDVEPASRAAAMEAIAAQVLHPEEGRALAAMDAPGRALALLQLWVRKEALLKAAGIGLAREMPSFVAPAGRRLRLPLERGGDGPEEVVLHMPDIGDDWVAALACPDGLAPVVTWVTPPAR